MVLLMLPLALVTTKAADVTDARWVTRNDAPIPYVRMVIDLSKPVEAAASIDSSGYNTTVTLKNSQLSGAPTVLNMDKTIAPAAKLTQNGKNVDIDIRSAKALDVGDVKVFSLKKDASANKPYRLVIDIQKKGVAPKSNYYGSAKPAAEKTKSQPQKSYKPTANTKPPAYRVSNGLAGKIITIDPGHGGSDPGAIGPHGLMEKNVTLPISKYLKSELEARGAKVLMTRTTDVDVYGPHASGPDELQARVDVANNNDADLFVSVHINSFANPSVNGVATYYYSKTKYDTGLAQKVQSQIAAEPGFDNDRGIQPGDLYVLRHTAMPAILVELGFISNPTEESLLNTDTTQRSFARRIADGIQAYFGR